ncbi:MAG: hypothetical protein J6B72_04445 [Clostridia bacterium]|nr:hypothetical protein [Clostridia bacterium]
MKKILSILLVILTVSSTLCINIHATNDVSPITDSLNISQEEYDLLKNSDNDVIIKLFNSIYMPFFAERKTVDDLLDQGFVCYLVPTNEDTVCSKRIINGTVTTAKDLSWYKLYIYDFLYDCTLSYDTLFNSTSATSNIENLKVLEIYCLNGMVAYNGIYIYFVTDNGDYVYYNQLCYGDRSKDIGYLMPLNVFYNFAAEAESTHDPDGDVGYDIDATAWSEYVVEANEATETDKANETNNSKSENKVFSLVHLAWIIPSAVVLIGGISFICCKKTKSKKAS